MQKPSFFIWCLRPPLLAPLLIPSWNHLEASRSSCHSLCPPSCSLDTHSSSWPARPQPRKEGSTRWDGRPVGLPELSEPSPRLPYSVEAVCTSSFTKTTAFFHKLWCRPHGLGGMCVRGQGKCQTEQGSASFHSPSLIIRSFVCFFSLFL